MSWTIDENRFGIGVGIDCTHRSSVANTARSNRALPLIGKGSVGEAAAQHRPHRPSQRWLNRSWMWSRWRQTSAVLRLWVHRRSDQRAQFFRQRRTTRFRVRPVAAGFSCIGSEVMWVDLPAVNALKRDESPES
jgi:hypothetical protein